MRAIWKGAISFGLVNIPVALYPATRHEELKFHLLRASDLSPINYKRVAEADGKEVPKEQIVKGFEYEKGRFVVLQEDDFARIEQEASHTVHILDFVQLDQVDPMFFSKPYYMEPEKGGERAYALLREALVGSGKIGIAKVVIRTREYLAAVKPARSGLVLELLHFADEMADPSELRLPEGHPPSPKELQMAKALIEGLTTDWNPEKYKDEYRDAVLHLIEEKVEHGGELPGKAKPAAPRKHTIDLLPLLEQSLRDTEAARKNTKPPKGGKAA